MYISIIGWSFVIVGILMMQFVSVLIQRRLTDLNKKIVTLNEVVDERLLRMDILVLERIDKSEAKAARAYNQREARLQEWEQRVEQKYYEADRLAAELTIHIVNVTSQLWDYSESLKASQSDTQADSGSDGTPATDSGAASEASTDTNTYPD